MESPHFRLPKPCWVCVAHSPCRQWVMATELASLHGGHHLSGQEKSLQALGGLSLAAGAPAQTRSLGSCTTRRRMGAGVLPLQVQSHEEERRGWVHPQSTKHLQYCPPATGQRAAKPEGHLWRGAPDTKVSSHLPTTPRCSCPRPPHWWAEAPPLPRDWPPPAAGCFFLHF